MALITATWKVTHNSVVLLDVSDYMNDEPRLVRAFVVDRFAALATAGIISYGRQNVSHNATFTRVIAFGSDAAARSFMQTHTLALAVGEHDCTIQWLGVGPGTPTPLTNTLKDCVIVGYNARTEANFFFADYSLQGGELV